MKVVFVSRFPPVYCGIAEYADYLIRQLISLRGAPGEVIVVANKDTQDVEDYEYPPGVSVERCWVSGIPNYNELKKCLEVHEDADIIHFQHEYSIFPMRIEFLELLEWIKKRLSKAKIVITLHTVKKPVWVSLLGPVEEAAKRDRAIVDYQRKVVDLADAVIVHHSHMAIELWMQGVNASKIKVIPHGTAINPYLNEHVAKLENILGLELSKEMFKLGVPGFIRIDKGLDILLKAVEEVSKKYDVLVVVSGEPQGETGIRALREIDPKLKEAYVVRVPGFLSRRKLYALLRLLDLAVLPYREDPGHLGVSGALHIAIGSLVPVVCTLVPRLIECHTHAPELSTPPEDAKMLAKKIEWVIENYHEANILSTKLWSYGVETSWQRIARLHLILYEELSRS